ncbi:MAG: M14 family zinc carboxypeptidase [Myxococcaceae bacterium]|nr:M14 family zinc carboxypeptidase [Myxococcaceae bacterium]
MTFLLALLAAAPSLSTHAERTGFTETGRFAEVEALCAAFPKAFPRKVRCDRFGVTPLGRPMLALVASADGVLTPEVAAKKARPVVFLQGGIHAGEIDGKDAGFWLLRDVLEGRVAPGALTKVTIVFVPVFNVDGHERFGPNQRPNQVGPKEMGWRVTSQNLNLNRDYAKADAPEMQAMLRLLQRWDPILTADLHVTDGAKFQHDVSITFEPSTHGPEGLRALGVSLREGLFTRLEAKSHLPVNFYPSFNKEDDPASGFSYGWPPPRFSNAYWAAHNRFGLLVETHSWKDYRARVAATYDVCLGLLELAATNGSAWLTAAKAADAADARRPGEDVVLLWEPTKTSRLVDFKGYAYTREPSSISGQPWVRYDETKPETWRVPYFDELKPSLTVKAPSGGWVIPPPHAAWVAEKLALHGVAFSRLPKELKAVAVERFRLSEPKFRATPYEGRLTVTAREGLWAPAELDLPAGSLFVPTAQARLVVALHLLEPASPESFLAWGFFNAHLEQKEYLEDYLTEAFARELLQDAGVRADFEGRLKNPDFAKDPSARLRFFSSRHPSADPLLNVVPIYRVASPL